MHLGECGIWNEGFEGLPNHFWPDWDCKMYINTELLEVNQGRGHGWTIT